MTRPRRVPRAADPGGFTLIELLIGMAIFIVLGGMAVFLMRRGLDLFSVGTRDAALQDRMDVVVPQLQRDLAMLTIPHRFDAPPPLPSDEASMFGEKPPSPPPVDERLRSGWVVMQDVPEELKARTDTKGEASLRGHLKAEGDEQTGSQSYIPPDPKDDKALNTALELIRGIQKNSAYPPNPKAAVPN